MLVETLAAKSAVHMYEGNRSVMIYKDVGKHGCLLQAAVMPMLGCYMLDLSITAFWMSVTSWVCAHDSHCSEGVAGCRLLIR